MISIINNANSTVAYFKQDDYDQLIAGGVNKRAVEKGGVQKLLQELAYHEEEICYKESGQPYFKDKPELFLSVSHAKGWFAVSVGSEPVGVDIQTYSPRLKQGQDYFRNDRELSFSEDEIALHLIWGAKEAFYKLKEGQIADLKEEVSISGISKDLLLLDYGSETFKLGYQILENAFIVFTL
jgi:4'-phosphopantetheinyl transferase